jgi:hypothetical protein
MVRILGSTGSRRRRRYQLAAIFSVTALLAGFAALPAQAVHDVGVFELEGNATNDPAVAGDDWDNVCHEVTHSDCSTTSDTTGATAVSWVSEPDRSSSIFTGGGSKDPNDVSAWLWKDAGGLPDKDNLRHAFAARYSSTDELLYFGSDRFDNSGDAQQGFWFLQSPLAADGAASGGGFKFTDGSGGVPAHVPGDLLVLSDFSIGGTVSTINIYQWVASGGDTTTHLDFVDGGTNVKCDPSLSGDNFCGIVNPVTTTSPWPFLDKSNSTSFLQGEFYEAGINLSGLGFGGECFTTVVSETRSSTSPTATLKDFVVGQFGKCESELHTTPSSGSVSIGTGSASVTDSADLNVTGATTFDGKLKFFLCFIDTDPTATGLCGSGGTQIGPDQAVTTNGTYASEAATVTSAGRYCWRGEFTSTTPGVPPATDATEAECFIVTPVTPTLTTQASGPVALGSPISDTATLKGTANQPGTPVINPTTPGALADGTITITAFGPGNCTTVAFGPTTIAVSGDGTYGPVSFTPSAVGTYTFVASYSGNLPNTKSVPASGCPDTTGTETVTVSDTSSVTSAQNWLPNDEATVTSAGGSPLSGTLTFTLYETANCTGTAVNGQTYTRDLSGAASPATRSTNNTTYLVSADKTVSWLVTFDSSNPNVADSAPVCETTSLTIDNDVPPGI